MSYRQTAWALKRPGSSPLICADSLRIVDHRGVEVEDRVDTTRYLRLEGIRDFQIVVADAYRTRVHGEIASDLSQYGVLVIEHHGVEVDRIERPYLKHREGKFVDIGFTAPRVPKLG